MAQGQASYGYDQPGDKDTFAGQQPPPTNPPGYYAGGNYAPPPVASPQYPPSATNTTVIVQQPQVVQAPGMRPWSSDLCSCFDDMGLCLCGTFCGLCLACEVAQDMGESSCVPCCVPGWDIALRLKMRTQENIAGSLMNDCLTAVCCGPCALCQLAREVKYVKMRQGTLVAMPAGVTTTTTMQC